MKLRRPQAFAGFVIVSLIALIGFAAFSATGFRSAPPLDLPEDVTARIAGQILGVELGSDAPAAVEIPAPAEPSSEQNDARGVAPVGSAPVLQEVVLAGG